MRFSSQKKLKTMKRYLVTVNEDVFTTYVVEAEDRDEAHEKLLMGEYLYIDDTMTKDSEVILVEAKN